MAASPLALSNFKKYRNINFNDSDDECDVQAATINFHDSDDEVDALPRGKQISDRPLVNFKDPFGMEAVAGKPTSHIHTTIEEPKTAEKTSAGNGYWHHVTDNAFQMWDYQDLMEYQWEYQELVSQGQQTPVENPAWWSTPQHCASPASAHGSSGTSDGSVNEGTVTWMMRNVPNKYSQQLLLNEIDTDGFANTYDFFYLPIDPQTQANRGYAFLNFVTSDDATAFRKFYEGRQLKVFNSSKFVVFVPAKLQGFDANHAHYSSARVSRGSTDARPLFFRKGTVTHRRRTRGGHSSLIDIAGRFPDTRVNDIIARSLDDCAKSKSISNEKQLQQVCIEFCGTKASTMHSCPFCQQASHPDFKFCQACGVSLSTTQEHAKSCLP